MSKTFKKSITITCITVFFLGLFLVSSAGTFTPDPTSPGASTYTLEDIYNKITEDGYSAPSHTFAPSLAPASTFFTLSQIWDAIPSFRNTVSTGSNFLAGIYATTTDLLDYEDDLSAGNIKTDVDIFGVIGTYTAVSCTDLVDDLRNGLVAYLPLDDDTNDYSGNNEHATTTTATNDGGGKVGGAYSFDGADSKISFDSELIGNGADSACAWVNPNSRGEESYGRILDNAVFYLLPYSDTNLTFSSNGGTAAFSGEISDLLGDWHYFCIERDADGAANFYADGILSGSAEQDSGSPSAGSTNLTIGNNDIQDRSFDGLIDEVAIWDRSITAEEVAQLYNNGEGRSLLVP